MQKMISAILIVVFSIMFAGNPADASMKEVIEVCGPGSIPLRALSYSFDENGQLLAVVIETLEEHKDFLGLILPVGGKNSQLQRQWAICGTMENGYLEHRRASTYGYGTYYMHRLDACFDAVLIADEPYGDSDALRLRQFKLVRLTRGDGYQHLVGQTIYTHEPRREELVFDKMNICGPVYIKAVFRPDTFRYGHVGENPNLNYALTNIEVWERYLPTDPRNTLIYKQWVERLRELHYDDIYVFVDGRKLEFDTQPIIQNGRTLVPFRAIGEALGATIDWDDRKREVILTKDNLSVRLVVGSRLAHVGDQEVSLGVPAQVIGGRTMVPLRFVGEALDTDVIWDGKLKYVRVLSRQQ